MQLLVSGDPEAETQDTNRKQKTKTKESRWCFEHLGPLGLRTVQYKKSWKTILEQLKVRSKRPKSKTFCHLTWIFFNFWWISKGCFFFACLLFGVEWKFVSSGSASYSPDIQMSLCAHNRKRSPAPSVRSEVSDFVLQGGGDLLQAERQLPVLGGRVLVQRLDDLRNKILNLYRKCSFFKHIDLNIIFILN